MIRRLGLCRSQSTDPHRNLALEERLLESVGEDQCILYLWQNENTVVIGRNQNPWAECHTTLLEQEGGTLARRLSGGGAVFHDLGNLNFTFLLPQAEYDLDRQLTVIQEAVAALGVPTERSGRNDVLAAGRKFSGNAFYKNGRQAYHHGTLLVEADMTKMSRYLRPSKAKLQAKGVDSVRSRVVNLKELNPEITIPALEAALQAAFSRVYGLPVERISPESLNLEDLTSRYESWEWNYGRKLPFTFACEDRFPWGSLRLEIQVESGIIVHTSAFSDAMDWQFPETVCQSLTGSPFRLSDITERLENSGIPQAWDIMDLLTRQEL